MKNIVFLLFLVVMSLSMYSTSSAQDFEPLDMEQVIDSMKPYKDSTIFYIKETGKIWGKAIKENGFKDTMKKGKDIFLPIVIFLVLYLVWLRNRSRNN